ncbi:MAG: DNA-formamidopyrimidine glycosylase, partial [Deltaproteobacteria bacterium]|nr:DNA-formamidopyrimidine glycosylase [Deltaproteobacteria bacterium]
YGKNNQPCPECSVPILRIVQQQRSTFYCSECQK